MKKKMESRDEDENEHDEDYE
uniref:Uncharacterized protein n=1 Tax=Nymphaea colorata TaxID=210225 RepID=A0A5K0ZZ94_9MAGN